MNRKLGILFSESFYWRSHSFAIIASYRLLYGLIQSLIHLFIIFPFSCIYSFTHSFWRNFPLLKLDFRFGQCLGKDWYIYTKVINRVIKLSKQPLTYTVHKRHYSKVTMHSTQSSPYLPHYHSHYDYYFPYKIMPYIPYSPLCTVQSSSYITHDPHHTDHVS